MTTVSTVTLEVPDPAAAAAFYAAAFGPDRRLGVRASDAPTTGFRGFSVSLVVSQPGTVDALVGTALEAGATVVKPVSKSFWGYGGVVRAPDGAIWKVVSQSKKDTGPATRQVDDVVLLLGVADVAASKKFYVEHGLTVSKSFGRKYVEFDGPAGSVRIALQSRKAVAKDAGVPIDGTGSHRIVIGADTAGFVDPDGFAWESAPARVG